MPQGLPAHRPTAYGPAWREASTTAIGRVPEHSQARGPDNAQCSVAMSASPVRRRPNRTSTANSWRQQNQGPARSQRHHERTGRRLSERIEAVAATIEAEWAVQVGAPRLEELRATLSDLLTPGRASR